VNHSKGKDGKRTVAILRFQGGSPPPVSIKNRIILALKNWRRRPEERE
jgi:hypothetical protein